MRHLEERSTPPSGTAVSNSADAVGTATAEPNFRPLRIADGKRLWQIARDSQVLDVNSGYAYVLWCRDFGDTSVVATDGTDRPVGFVTGYRRPEDPRTLFVWQVAVDADQRGRGIAGRMLDHLLDRLEPLGVTRLETTVSPDNDASIAMFTALARRRGTHITRTELFAPDDFPDSHLAEDLYTIGE
ncbi:diaminobutyrate acetyltransferase [Rhodococcus sp. Z13]|uniref:Diaminobutyrate acetyltransferase n=1 Tax=Rhodococcus sacchari TaxID=2962047 RepID=A0ACD4DK90_9NOCA|nr:diaminobutyrate acetyltransferase [Rhodococcus sp. Z13]UYP20490.1 diaminobutyrate acetyltransferase [Rhodococcus sp. Z13]